MNLFGGPSLTKKLFGTIVLGRILGRATPYVGGAILVVDAVEMLLVKSSNTDSRFRDGGDFGGGGANGSW